MAQAQVVLLRDIESEKVIAGAATRNGQTGRGNETLTTIETLHPATAAWHVSNDHDVDTANKATLQKEFQTFHGLQKGGERNRMLSGDWQLRNSPRCWQSFGADTLTAAH